MKCLLLCPQNAEIGRDSVYSNPPSNSRQPLNQIWWNALTILPEILFCITVSIHRFLRFGLQEVEELRGKLNILRDKKKELLDYDNGNHEGIPSISEPDTSVSSSPVSTSPKRDSISDATIPSSPLRAHVRAYLPNNQRTTVSFPSVFRFGWRWFMQNRHYSSDSC